MARTPEQNRRTNKKILTFGCLPILALIAVIAIVAAVSSGDDGEPQAKKPRSGAPSIAERNKAREAAGLTLYPTGDARQQYLDALRSIDPWFVTDKGEMDAIENGVNQCDSGIDGKRPVWSAQQRFGKDGSDGRAVSEAEAEKINEIVVKYICPDKA